MNDIQVQQVIDAASAHKWWVLSAILIGLTVRLAKASPWLAAKIKPMYRTWFAFGLGVVSGVADNVINGTPIKTALVAGLIAAASAIVGHETIVESIRSGREIGVPKDEDATKKPPTPPAIGGAVFAFVFVIALFLISCAALQTPQAKSVEKGILTGANIACIFASALVAAPEVAEACGIEKELVPLVEPFIGQREAAKRAGTPWPYSAHETHAGAGWRLTCHPDAGAIMCGGDGGAP